MTALVHMAAARPPGIADARVPCPLCGGLIHPVAGRCKHCKEDLTSFRAGRPQAAAALPALNGKTNGSNGHAVAAAIPVAAPVMPVAHHDSQPILPPRTTARSVAVARAPSMWRSWPMLVIILAVIAIVAATVIMVMPQGSKKSDGKMSAPPAPERMDFNPMPDKQSQLDPWGGAPGSVPRTPDPQPMPMQPTPAPADPDDDDLWGSGGGGVLGGGGGGAFGTNGANFMITALDRACAKLKSCPDVDQSTLSSVCEAVSMMPKPPALTGCAAAQRCLNAIDRLSCSQAAQASPHSVFTMFDDCTRAATQC
jgi:hypothetical protein